MLIHPITSLAEMLLLLSAPSSLNNDYDLQWCFSLIDLIALVSGSAGWLSFAFWLRKKSILALEMEAGQQQEEQAG